MNPIVPIPTNVVQRLNQASFQNNNSQSPIASEIKSLASQIPDACTSRKVQELIVSSLGPEREEALSNLEKSLRLKN